MAAGDDRRARWWKLILYRACGERAEMTTATCRADSLEAARAQLAAMFADGWVLVDAREGISCADVLGDAAASQKQLSTKKWELYSLVAARRRRDRLASASGRRPGA